MTPDVAIGTLVVSMFGAGLFQLIKKGWGWLDRQQPLVKQLILYVFMGVSAVALSKFGVALPTTSEEWTPGLVGNLILTAVTMMWHAIYKALRALPLNNPTG